MDSSAINTAICTMESKKEAVCNTLYRAALRELEHSGGTKQGQQPRQNTVYHLGRVPGGPGCTYTQRKKIMERGVKANEKWKQKGYPL